MNKEIEELTEIKQRLQDAFDYVGKGFNDTALLYLGANIAKLDNLIERLKNE